MGIANLIPTSVREAIEGIKTRLTAAETAISGKADKATTLDGYGITDKIYKDNSNNSALDDCNNATSYGTYTVTSATNNSPNNSGGGVLLVNVSKLSGSYMIAQLMMGVSLSKAGNIYYRYYWGNTWSNWITV